MATVCYYTQGYLQDLSYDHPLTAVAYGTYHRSPDAEQSKQKNVLKHSAAQRALLVLKLAQRHFSHQCIVLELPPDSMLGCLCGASLELGMMLSFLTRFPLESGQAVQCLLACTALQV